MPYQPLKFIKESCIHTAYKNIIGLLRNSERSSEWAADFKRSVASAQLGTSGTYSATVLWKLNLNSLKKF